MNRRSFVKAIIAVGASTIVKPALSLLPKAKAVSSPASSPIGDLEIPKNAFVTSEQIKAIRRLLARGEVAFNWPRVHGKASVVDDMYRQNRPIGHFKHLELPKAKTVSFRRYEELPTVPEPLAEGMIPSGERLAYAEFVPWDHYYNAAKLNEEWLKRFEVASTASEVPLIQQQDLNKMAKRLGENVARVKESLIKALIKSAVR